jgi:DNA-binding IclR family transcriptional regulator
MASTSRTTRAGTGTQAIERATRVLRELGMRPNFGLGLTELSVRCDLDKGTTHRILACLVRERLVQQRPLDRRYLPGPLLFELGLGLRTHAELQASARPALGRIAKRFGGIAALTLRSGTDGVYAARAGQVAIRGMSVEVGDRRPLANTSAGVAILIALPPAETRRIMASNLERLAALGPERLRLIRRMIRQSSQRGFGINQDNTVVGVSGFGVAIRDRDGIPFAAVSVAGPAALYPAQVVPDIVANLHDEARALERDVARLFVRSSAVQRVPEL